MDDHAASPACLCQRQTSIDFTDPFGADVSLGQRRQPGRPPRRLGRPQASWQDEAGKTRRSNVYGIANLYYDFLGGSEVDVSGHKFETRPREAVGRRRGGR